MQTPDGTRILELVKFHSPSNQGDNRHAPANTPGIRHIAFAVEDGVVASLRARGASSSASWSAARTATGFATSAAMGGTLLGSFAAAFAGSLVAQSLSEFGGDEAGAEVTVVRREIRAVIPDATSAAAASETGPPVAPRGTRSSPPTASRAD